MLRYQYCKWHKIVLMLLIFLINTWKCFLSHLHWLIIFQYNYFQRWSLKIFWKNKGRQIYYSEFIPKWNKPQELVNKFMRMLIWLCKQSFPSSQITLQNKSKPVIKTFKFQKFIKYIIFSNKETYLIFFTRNCIEHLQTQLSKTRKKNAEISLLTTQRLTFFAANIRCITFTDIKIYQINCLYSFYEICSWF